MADLADEVRRRRVVFDSRDLGAALPARSDTGEISKDLIPCGGVRRPWVFATLN